MAADSSCERHAAVHCGTLGGGASLALEQRKEKEEGKEHSEVLQDTVWK